jgi:hypothetical protein
MTEPSGALIKNLARFIKIGKKGATALKAGGAVLLHNADLDITELIRSSDNAHQDYKAFPRPTQIARSQLGGYAAFVAHSRCSRIVRWVLWVCN